MRNILLLILLSLPLAAQSTLTLSGPPNVRPGQTITVDLTLGGSAAPAGLQWSLSVPAGLTATAAGGTALGSTKTLSCNTPICLAVGMNTATIPAGVVARYTVLVGAAAAKGSYPLTLTEPLAVSADGTALTVSLGAAYQLLILSRSDLNGDGLVNTLDFNLMVNQALGRAACTGDQNGDGRCNLFDVIAVIRASME